MYPSIKIKQYWKLDIEKIYKGDYRVVEYRKKCVEYDHTIFVCDRIDDVGNLIQQQR